MSPIMSANAAYTDKFSTEKTVNNVLLRCKRYSVVGPPQKLAYVAKTQTDQDCVSGRSI